MRYRDAGRQCIRRAGRAIDSADRRSDRAAAAIQSESKTNHQLKYVRKCKLITNFLQLTFYNTL